MYPRSARPTPSDERDIRGRGASNLEGFDMRRVHLVPMFVLTVSTVVAAQQPPAGAPAPRPMTLTTTAFPDGGQIPAKYTQAGEQVSPALTWTNTPAGTVSFVLHMHDID